MSVEGVNPDAVTVAGEQDGTALILAGIEDWSFSEQAYATVERVRDAVHAIPDADALVGGNAAVNSDVQEANQHDNRIVIPLVLVMVLLILVVLLRAIVAPLLLIGTVVLSFGAALGFSAWCSSTSSTSTALIPGSHCSRSSSSWRSASTTTSS